MKEKNSIPVTTGKGEILMNTKANLWGIIWLIVAFVGLIAVILGYYHHMMTVIVATFLMTIAKEEDNQSNSR